MFVIKNIKGIIAVSTISDWWLHYDFLVSTLIYAVDDKTDRLELCNCMNLNKVQFLNRVVNRSSKGSASLWWLNNNRNYEKTS